MAFSSTVKQFVSDRGFGHIIGQNTSLLKVFDMIDCVAMSDANILIQGESGTGKELIANAIHARSRRANGPFIKINCAAIPRDLIESELFGYRRGAFTGAIMDKKGLLELADHGSLLLDEIGEMPAHLQTKLLRVLQEPEYRPIGSERRVTANFRLIASTNADLDQALRDGKLREDLYFRINTIILKVPPLRERTDDIPLLCDHFLEKYRRRHQTGIKTLSPATLSQLMRNRFAGNVRELENAIERGVLVSRGAEIMPGDLPESLRQDGSDAAAEPIAIAPPQTLAEIEKVAILQTLHSTRWNKRKAADILGVYRPTLYNKMKKHGIREVGALN